MLIFIREWQLSSDIGFFKCVDDSVKALAQHNAYPVFYYQYAHRGQLSLVEILDIPKDSDFGRSSRFRFIHKLSSGLKFHLLFSMFRTGVAHADEILLMFPNYLMPRLSHPNDLKVSKMLLDLWTSFAADG